MKTKRTIIKPLNYPIVRPTIKEWDYYKRTEDRVPYWDLLETVDILRCQNNVKLGRKT